MDCNEEDSNSEFGKRKPNFSEIYKDLLFSEQINSSGMFSTPPVLNTYLIYLIHLLLIMLAIAVLEVHVHLQICYWIHMMRRF